MPRPAEEEQPKRKKCWERSTTQERVLLFVSVLSIMVIIVLLFLIAQRHVQAENVLANTCVNTACLTESSKIAEFINSDVNPCDDFYEFACGNFLENAHGDENLALPGLVVAEAKRELLGAYKEPINESEHEMVIVAKKLFRACMDESEIEKDGLNSIREVITDLGGWPVVEGPGWNDKNFNWTKATYKLRGYGYPFSIFLGVTVDVHPLNFSRYIFKIETPQLWDYSTRHFDKIQLMTELAEMFGARDKNRALQEMTKAHDFLTDLQREIHNTYTLGSASPQTINEYQKQCPSVNWLEFLQNIIGPTVKISADDEVVFPPPRTFNSWLDLISKTPKRTQANYMIWKLIETALPYLARDLRSYATSHYEKETRDEFCLREIQQRFSPSPIVIMCDRKYLSISRKQKVEELVENIKSELVETAKNIKWMDEKEKKKALNIAKGITIVIGQAKDYFDNQILEDLNFDMVEIKKETFLNLVMAADRNHQTMSFNEITLSPVENINDKWYMKTFGTLPVYSTEDNILYIPITSIRFLYNEDRPNYLNYGALGTYIGNLLSVIITKYIPTSTYSPYYEKLASNTKKAGNEKLKCMEKLAKSYNEDLSEQESSYILQQHIGGEISYRAYEKWVKGRGEEKTLIGNPYRPHQLYWISQALIYCVPSSAYGDLRNISYSGLVFLSMGNNADFAKDFNCPEGSKMNPSNRCLLT